MKTPDNRKPKLTGPSVVGKMRIEPEEERRMVAEFTEKISYHVLMFFKMLGLKTHIETLVVNDPTGEKFILSFKTVDKHRMDAQETDHLQSILSHHAKHVIPGLEKRIKELEGENERLSDLANDYRVRGNL